MSSEAEAAGAPPPERPSRKNRGTTALLTNLKRVFDRRSSAGEASEDDEPPAESGGRWDLSACVDVIETLKGADQLTPEQQAAIAHLRAATGRSRPGKLSSNKRREAKFFGKSRNPLLTKELLKCFHEVEGDDADQQENVTAVLATFGGQVFDGVSSLAPRSAGRKKDIGESGQSLSTDEKKDTGESSHSIDDSARSLDINSSFRHFSTESERRDAAVGIKPLDSQGSLADFFASAAELRSSQTVYCPPEWNALTKKAREKLTGLLSWDNLSRWDFNIMEVAAASRDTLKSMSLSDTDRTHEEQHCPLLVSERTHEEQHCPLLFVGWAVLCAPYAQTAMEGSLGDNSSSQKGGPPSTHSFPYYFVDSLKISPEVVCNFLRQIERMYVSKLPYHNNTHAADVTQTLHCLLQMMGQEYLEGLYDAIDIFSILLAATFHDVGHEGTNNLYQKNARTDLAIQYNDASILENMHSAVGHSLLMGSKKQREWDVLRDWSDGQKDRARDVMIRAVLGTDMSKHFETTGELASLVEKVRAGDAENNASGPAGVGEPRSILSILLEASDQRREGNEAPNDKACTQLTKLLLKFLLHAADISNPTKSRELAIYWADQALAEFFAQGDLEEANGIPVSPLCDRRTVKRADSQIGFGKFVIRPTFGLLGDVLPRVKDEVLPMIDDNIMYWTRTKARLSGMRNMKNNLAMMKAVNRQAARKKSSIDEGSDESEEASQSERESDESTDKARVDEVQTGGAGTE